MKKNYFFVLTCLLLGNAVLSQTITYDGATHKTIQSPHTGIIWLDKNIDATQVATSSTADSYRTYLPFLDTEADDVTHPPPHLALATSLSPLGAPMTTIQRSLFQQPVGVITIPWTGAMATSTETRPAMPYTSMP